MDLQADCWSGSRSSRSAWIEIGGAVGAAALYRCRAPRGARGLKFNRADVQDASKSRAPRGARGLKLCGQVCIPEKNMSRSSRSAWIEIEAVDTIKDADKQVALLAERVD